MSGIFVLLFFCLLACSDENAFSAGKEDVEEAKEYLFSSSSYENEEYACWAGTSTYTDFWCCSNYGYRCYEYEESACWEGTSTHTDSWCCSNYGYRCYSSSSRYAYSSSSACNSWYGCSSSSSYTWSYSSSSAAKYYLETSKTLYFTLTYYRQLRKMDEDYIGDGDPEISFELKFEKTSGNTTIKNSGVLLKLSDQGSWSGSKTASFTVPVYTEKIFVCPIFVEKDVFFDDTEYGSGSCYGIKDVGYLDDLKRIYQEDKNTSYYTLEWNWYLD